MGIPFGKSVRGNHTTGTNDVRGNRTTGTNATKHGHSYSVCITNSNGKPNVINTARYKQSGLYYIGNPMNVSPNMESRIITYDKVKGIEKGLSCDNQWTRNRN
jgi:hypothetical protein